MVFEGHSAFISIFIIDHDGPDHNIRRCSVKHVSDDDNLVIVGPSLATVVLPFCSLSGQLLFETGHHGDELLKLDLAIAILVNLLDNCVDGFSAERVRATEAENLADLVGGDDARAVLVEHAEGGMQLLLGGEAALAGCRHNEFGVVDEAAIVGVDGAEHLLNFLVGHDTAVVLQVSLLDFLHGELAVAVLVEGPEDLGQVVTLLLAHELRGDEGVGGLLEGNIRLEFAKVVEGVDGERLVDLEGGKFSKPSVLEGLLSRRSLFSSVREEGADEALGVVRDLLPSAVLEGESTLTDLLHDLLVGLTVEGRHAGEENKSDDAARPDIALVVIVLVKNLRGDVVGRAELLVEVAVRVVHERGTEVDDLDLIELLVSLEQDVLRLQVTMDDVGLVAVVDARENLLHKDSSVTLAELSALQDLIEELTTLADSR